MAVCVYACVEKCRLQYLIRNTQSTMLDKKLFVLNFIFCHSPCSYNVFQTLTHGMQVCVHIYVYHILWRLKLKVIFLCPAPLMLSRNSQQYVAHSNTQFIEKFSLLYIN